MVIFLSCLTSSSYFDSLVKETLLTSPLLARIWFNIYVAPFSSSSARASVPPIPWLPLGEGQDTWSCSYSTYAAST